MQLQDSSFRDTLDHVRSGSEEAIWELIEAYGPHIHRVVRRRLNRRMRSKFDSIDFVQMVWASFFRDPAEINSFSNPDELTRYLCKIAKNKVTDEHRKRFETDKHKITREQRLGEAEVGQDLARSSDPTPSQIASAREYYSQLVRGQPSRHRHVVKLRLKGATYEEIASQLSIHPNTARRIIARVTGTRLS